MKILKRLIGIFLFIIGVWVMTIPFVLVLIVAGLDVANVMMNYVMRVPLNLMIGGKSGDELLELRRQVLRDKE